MSDNLVRTSNGEINPAFETSENHIEEDANPKEYNNQNSVHDSVIEIGFTSKVSKGDSISEPKDATSSKSIQSSSGGLTRGFYKYRGIACALLAAIFLSLGTFYVKLLRMKGYSQYLTTFWRFLGVLVPAFPLIAYYEYYKKVKVFRTIYPFCKGDRMKTSFLLTIRCIVGTGSFLFQYAALANCELADVSVIVFSSTVFVGIFAYCCLGEDFGFTSALIAVFTVVGVVIIAKPPFIFGGNDMSRSTVEGFLYAIAAMLTTSLAFILLRFLREIHFALMALVFGTFGTVVGIILSFAIDNSFIAPKNFYPDTLYFLAIAVLSCFGQIFLTLAFKYEEAGPVSVLRATDPIFSFLWQLVVGVYPNAYSLGGGAIVITCVFLTGFRKWLSTLKPEHRWRVKLWFLLKVYDAETLDTECTSLLYIRLGAE